LPTLTLGARWLIDNDDLSLCESVFELCQTNELICAHDKRVVEEHCTIVLNASLKAKQIGNAPASQAGTKENESQTKVIGRGEQHAPLTHLKDLVCSKCTTVLPLINVSPSESDTT
jgi:hypothetical protein